MATTERFHAARELYERVETLPAGERAAILEAACDGDPALRREVESLLAAGDAAGAFLEAPAVDTGSVAGAARTGEAGEGAGAPGARTHIQGYEVLRLLGSGGMGQVFLARRTGEDFAKQVAIKVIRPGMQSDLVVRRFRAERQILAGLDHPGIARLYDGGSTEEGLPYFVMEHVEGQDLLGYCDDHQMSIAQRVALFASVCDAVQFAHQHLVVHRDLKPSNILVGADGEPKLLDFGIAKLVDTELSEGRPETTMLRAMTPEYASPEQVRGGRVTTASDVYSLGVLLYELVSGQRPYRLASRRSEDIERAVCQEEPERPSEAAVRADTKALAARRTANAAKLSRLLRDDLDNVALKALEKEPTRRYPTAAELAADLRRHLEGLPVLARPARIGYRAVKFLRRHRLGVSAAAAIVLSLVAGLAIAWWQATVARAERARAEQRFEDVRRLANSLLFELHEGIAHLPGSTPVRAILVQRALEYLDRLARETPTDPLVARELAAAYEKVGDAQGDPWSDNLGDLEGALASYQKAEALRLALRERLPADLLAHHQLLVARRKIGTTLAMAARDSEGEPIFRQAVAEDTIALPETGSPAERQLVAEHWVERARVARAIAEYDVTYDLAPMEGHYARALAVLSSLRGEHPEPQRIEVAVAAVHSDLGQARALFGPRAQALEHLRQAVAIREKVAALDATNARVRLDMLADLAVIGRLLRREKDTAGALAVFEQGIATAQIIAAQDPLNARARRLQAQIELERGHLHLELGSPRSALGDYRLAAGRLEALTRDDPTNDVYPSYLTASYKGLAKAATALAMTVSAHAERVAFWQEVRGTYRRALELAARLAGQSEQVGHAPDDHELRAGVAAAQAALDRLGASS